MPRHDIAPVVSHDVQRALAMSVRTAQHGNAMHTLYSMQRSGNSYKVRLALAQLGMPYRLVEIDILRAKATRRNSWP